MLTESKDVSHCSPASDRQIPPVPFPSKQMNVNASSFEPIVRGRSQLRAGAAEFIPSSVKSGKQECNIYKEIVSLVENSGCLGINVIDIPDMYLASRGNALDLVTLCNGDLSTYIRSITEVRVKNSRAVPISTREALLAAGFQESQTADEPGETMGCRDNGHVRSRNLEPSQIPPLIGADYDKVVVHVRFEKYVDELRTFRESILEVISNFMSLSSDPSTGLSLSLFSSEWDKFFVSKGLTGMPSFKALRERFSVVKLMTFLQSIPGLEVVGSHPEIRVKVQPNVSNRPIVLSNELPTRQPPVLEIKQHISPPLVSQLLSQVDRQVLELGTFLATKGPQTSSQDLVLIRLQLQQLHCLKTSLQAVLRPLPITQAVVPPFPQDMPPGLPKTLLSGPSTAATSRKASPQKSPIYRSVVSLNDFINFMYRLIERACSEQQGTLFADPNPCNIGIPVNRIKEDWTRRYPSLNDLSSCLESFKVGKLKDFLLSTNSFGDSLVLFYSTLPSPQLKVSTRAHFVKFFKPDHPGTKLITIVSKRDDSSAVQAPLISPSSTCSYTSDQVGDEEIKSPTAGRRLHRNRLVTELVLKQVRLEQVAILEKKSGSDKRVKILLDIFKLVESTGTTKGSRPLESRRPPPIDTGIGGPGKGGVPSVFPLMKNFCDFVTSLIISEHLFGGPSEVVGLPLTAWASTWAKEYPDELALDHKVLSHVPGIRISGGSDGVKKCTIAALSTPSAAIASLFNIADKTVWNGENVRLIELVSELVGSVLPPSSSVQRLPPSTFTNPPTTTTTNNQLSDLSSVIFKSIMSGGPAVARECATALRVLAAQDPKAIHEIVSDHVARLKHTPSEEAADRLIKSLISRSNELGKSSTTQTNKTEELRRLMGIKTTSSSKTNVYSKAELLAIRKRFATEPIPPELVNLRLEDRKK